MAKVEFIPDVRIARQATALHRALEQLKPGAGTIPPFDLDLLLWEHLQPIDGLVLEEDEDLGGTDANPILGKTVLEEKRIYLTKGLRNKPFFPFTYAHEIGHWILHCRKHLDQASFLDDNAAVVGPFTTYYRAVSNPSECYDPLEVQANKFASCLLMPEDLVKEHFLARFQNDQGVMFDADDDKLRDYARELAKREDNGMISLAMQFGVSVESMGIRLITLGLAASKHALA